MSAEQCPGMDAALPRLAFVHVPKTAGTSVTSALLQAYGSLALPAMTTLDYPNYSDAEIARYRFYRGHAYRRDYCRLPPDTRFLTVLRDPVDRALSYYAYYRSIDVERVVDPFVLEAVQLCRLCSPIEFIYSDSPFVIEHLRLGQMRQFLSPKTLAKLSHRQFLTRALQSAALQEFVQELQRFEFVITCDALAIAFPLAADALGLPARCQALAHENASRETVGADRADVRRALVDVSGIEFEAYEYVRQRQWVWLSSLLPPRNASEIPSLN